MFGKIERRVASRQTVSRGFLASDVAGGTSTAVQNSCIFVSRLGSRLQICLDLRVGELCRCGAISKQMHGAMATVGLGLQSRCAFSTSIFAGNVHHFLCYCSVCIIMMMMIIIIIN